MSRILADDQFGGGPGGRQVRRRRHRAHHVVAALHDETGNVADPPRPVEKRVLRQEYPVGEIMRLDARQAEGQFVALELRDRLGAGMQRRTAALVTAPCERRRHVHGGVGVVETAAVGGEQVAALARRHGACEIVPRFGEETPHAVKEPVDLLRPAQEDPAQRQRPAALGMRLRIGQRQGRPPRTAENDPASDAEICPQPFDIGDEMRSGVVRQRAERTRPPGAALVEDHDAVMRRVEEPPVARLRSRARPAMQEHDGRAVGPPALLPIHDVPAAERQTPGCKRRDLGIQPAFRRRFVASHARN